MKLHVATAPGISYVIAIRDQTGAFTYGFCEPGGTEVIEVPSSVLRIYYYTTSWQFHQSFSMTRDAALFVAPNLAISVQATAAATTSVAGWTLPDWAAASPEASSFFGGLCMAATIRLTRAGLRWFKRVGKESYTHGD